MPTIPKKQDLKATTPDILNAIRDNASQAYQDVVPRAVPGDLDSLREIGKAVTNFTATRNEFLNALVNRIGRVIISSKMYENPWAMFKKGLLEFGETVEEIFVNIAHPFQYDPEKAETNIYKRVFPDVRAAFHTMNYQKFYKNTIQNDQLRQAFLSWQGITDLIAKIVDAMYTAANYDEFQTMKYMIAVNALSGSLYPVTIPTVNKDNAGDIVTSVKGLSNTLEFMSSNYNQAGVMTYTPKRDQIVLINAMFDATMDVNVLATAFNIDKVEFMGQRVLVDGFGNFDVARMDELLGDNPGYHKFTQAELDALNSIPLIIVDRDWFMIFDNLFQFTENYNGEGLYWNYWYHLWKTFSVSPFANATIFVPGTPTITSITVSPATATIAKGGSQQFSATVTGDDFAPNKVTWSVNSDISQISPSGVLTVSKNETATSLTVTATSTFDSTKTATATVTVG